jgi:hypothetical protein
LIGLRIETSAGCSERSNESPFFSKWGNPYQLNEWFLKDSAASSKYYYKGAFYFRLAVNSVILLAPR